LRSGIALLLLVHALGACRTTVELAVEGSEPQRPTLEPSVLQILESARESMDAGDARGASDRYSSLATSHPDDPWLASLHQEARFALLGVDTEDLEANLRRSYREAAEADPTRIHLLLAARAEPDAYAALNLANRSLEEDPDFAWGHYARGHALAQLGETEAARKAVERAVVLDASHLPAWRLLAWLRAQAGEREAAIATWQAWLRVATDDPRVSSEVRIAAVCDLGVLLVRAKRHEEAVSLLDAAASDLSGRSSSVLAAAAVEIGDQDGALSSVRSAREQDPEVLLYTVQEALLLERREAHSPAARAAWEEVFDRTEGAEDLNSLLQRTRAEAHLRRMKRELDLEPEG